MKTKFINSKQAILLGKKFEVDLDQEKIKKLPNGHFLFRRKNLETGKIVEYFLSEIYFKPFIKKYSVNLKIKSGKELLISNFELPREKVLSQCNL